MVYSACQYMLHCRCQGRVRHSQSTKLLCQHVSQVRLRQVSHEQSVLRHIWAPEAIFRPRTQRHDNITYEHPRTPYRPKHIHRRRRVGIPRDVAKLLQVLLAKTLSKMTINVGAFCDFVRRRFRTQRCLRKNTLAKGMSSENLSQNHARRDFRQRHFANSLSHPNP